MYQDKTLVCKECSKDFIFTEGEQEFFASKGLVNEPLRCKECRDAKKAKMKKERVFYDAVCAECGKEAKVPFKPIQDKPVFCSDCYASHK